MAGTKGEFRPVNDVEGGMSMHALCRHFTHGGLHSDMLLILIDTVFSNIQIRCVFLEGNLSSYISVCLHSRVQSSGNLRLFVISCWRAPLNYSVNTGSLHRRLLNSIQNLDFLINSISIHEDHILNTDAENFNAKSLGVLKV